MHLILLAAGLDFSRQFFIPPAPRRFPSRSGLPRIRVMSAPGRELPLLAVLAPHCHERSVRGMVVRSPRRVPLPQPPWRDALQRVRPFAGLLQGEGRFKDGPSRPSPSPRRGQSGSVPRGSALPLPASPQPPSPAAAESRCCCTRAPPRRGPRAPPPPFRPHEWLVSLRCPGRASPCPGLAGRCPGPPYAALRAAPAGPVLRLQTAPCPLHKRDSNKQRRHTFSWPSLVLLETR